VESKKKKNNQQTKNRKRLINTENKLVVARKEVGRRGTIFLPVIN